MEDLVARAREADARLAAVREGAVPAGDPDPYREPPGASGDDEDDQEGDRDDIDDLDDAADHGAGYSPA
jgi:ribosome-binding factor A